MPKKLYKTLLGLLLAGTIVFIPVFWLTFKTSTDLEVNFLDIGQGDSALIETPYGQNILIDGGPDGEVIKELGENLSWWDRTIDLMILTHPHDDHVTGLVDVLKRYNVKKILYTGVTHNSPAYLEWLDVVRDKKIPIVIIKKEQSIRLGDDCYLDIVYPTRSFFGATVKNLNNTSIVSRLLCDNDSFLFTGDIETDVEKELVEIGVDLKARVLKVAHHGSNTSSTLGFIEKVNPEIAVISVGKDNHFNHPSPRVINRFEREGVKVFRTDFDGMISLSRP